MVLMGDVCKLYEIARQLGCFAVSTRVIFNVLKRIKTRKIGHVGDET